MNHLFAQLNGFKYSKWLQNIIGPIDETLTGTTTPGGPRSDGSEGVLYIS